MKSIPEKLSTAFTNFYKEVGDNPTYKELCFDIQGIPTSCYNMMNKDQWKHFEKTITKLSKVNDSFLEFACGNGNILLYLENLKPLNGFGVDILEEALPPLSVEKYQQLDLNKEFEFKTKFDFAYCLDGIYNVPNKEKQIERILKTLNPGGFLYLTFSETSDTKLKEKKLPQFTKTEYTTQDQLMWDLAYNFIIEKEVELGSFLYKTKRSEIDNFLKLHKSKKVRRFSYIFHS